LNERSPRRPAVVTGGSSGIGAACAAALAAAGHPVVVASRRRAACEQVATTIRDAGGEAVALTLDLGDPSSIDRFAQEAPDAVGDVEVLVSNAGDVLPVSALGTEPDHFAAQVQVNLVGAHRLVHRIGAPMVERRRGDLVFVSSDVVRVPRPQMSSYVASKWGLEGLARAMQMELEGTGVRASIVRPGPTATSMGADWDLAMIGPVLDEWRRWGLVRHDGYLTPEAVAGAVVAVVGAPAGTHLTLVEVEPEAPVSRPPGPG
jgi:NAD(P)-dependent dehydrogenase (short-subunit alcohol dehydrogenase family)